MASSGDGLYEVKETPTKGLGMFAKVKISRGQLVVAEKALIVLPPLDMLGPTSLEDQSMSKLTADEKKLFYSSVDSRNPSKPTFIGILQTNSLPLGAGAIQAGFFPIIARINHSCLPNVHHSWNSLERVEKIYAVKDIEAGEEILTCYLNPYATRADRQRMLRLKFNFDCSCPACSLTDPKDVQASDLRRSKIAMLDELVSTQTSTQPSQAAFRTLDKLLELLKEEGMDYEASAHARASYDYFSLLYQTGQTKHLGLWARRTITNRIICEGSNSDAFLQARFKSELLRYYNPRKSSKKN